MSDALLLSAEPNGFDNLPVDVARLFREQPLGRRAGPAKVWDCRLRRAYAAPWLPLPLRHAAWHVLRRTQLDQAWFERFRPYWSQVLGGRPLWGVHDFYFLRNLYRMRFQRSRSLPDTQDAGAHLDAWQQPAVLSHLFHSVYKESLFTTLPLLARLRAARKPLRRVLEFGCGTAPVATTLFEFQRPRGVEVLIADIATVSFHYAAWKLAEFPNVRALPLRPEDDFRLRLDEPLDAIFCMAVFEHLNRPLETIATFRRLLAPGGVLVFDYIQSSAEGLDSHQGLRERAAVVAFIEEHFRLLHGRLDAEGSMGVTVVSPR